MEIKLDGQIEENIGKDRKTVPENKLKNKPISFMVDEDEKQRLEEYCRDQDISRSLVIRRALKKEGII